LEIVKLGVNKMVLRKAWIHGGDGDDHKVQMLNMVTLEVKMTDG